MTSCTTRFVYLQCLHSNKS